VLNLAAIDDLRMRLKSQEENEDGEFMYSMPFSPSALSSLRSLLSDGVLVPERLAWLDADGAVTQMPDTEGIVEGVGGSICHIFVTFVNRNVAAAKRIKKGQLRCGDMGLSIHKVWRVDAPSKNAVVGATPINIQHVAGGMDLAAAGALVLSMRSVSLENLQASRSYTVGKIVHAFDVVRLGPPPSAEATEAQELIASSLASGNGVSSDPDEPTKACLHWLNGCGAVEMRQGRWQLTDAGVLAITSAWTVSHSQLLLRDERADVDVKDKTMYELLLMMHKQGWTLIGTSKIKRVADIAAPYVHNNAMD